MNATDLVLLLLVYTFGIFLAVAVGIPLLCGPS